MSTQPQTEVYTCAECNGPRSKTGVEGSYCSHKCYFIHKGEKALNLLKHDHRLCASCGSVLKTVEPPTDEWKHINGSPTQVALDNGGELVHEDGLQFLDLTDVADKRPLAVDSVIGFEYRTTNAVSVEREFPGSHKYSRIIGKGIGCTCGNTDPSERIEELQEIDRARILRNYVTTFRRLYAEGQTDKRLDRRVFFETYRDSGGDMELALGKGLYYER